MRNKDVIELITLSYDSDDVGNQIAVPKFRKVYCNQLAIGSNEFHSAGQNGLKADKGFKMHAFEYHEESRLRYNEKYYRIYRTGENGDKVNLYCQEVIADDILEDSND